MTPDPARLPAKLVLGSTIRLGSGSAARVEWRTDWSIAAFNADGVMTAYQPGPGRDWAPPWLCPGCELCDGVRLLPAGSAREDGAAPVEDLPAAGGEGADPHEGHPE